MSTVVAGSVLAGFLVVAQAFAVTALVVGTAQRRSLLIPAVAVATVLGLRAVLSFVVDGQAASAAARVAVDMRRRVLSGLLDSTDAHASPGAAASLATHGIDAAEPYLTRYLPAALLSFIVPPLVLVAIASQDLLAAGIVLATLPLVPIFGWLVGAATRERAEAQWRAMSSLAGHFVDVMRGLPTLVAFNRAQAQSRSIATVSARYRRRTMETLRIAFASSAVLELVATLSVALVAVVVGTRLALGDMRLSTALVVLLLAPEAYAPIRRAGAEFHAAAEGRAAFADVAAYAAAHESSDGSAEIPTGDLALHEVTVRYSGKARPTLDALSARIPARGLTVVVGPSGAGKSTLLGVIAGVVPHQSGSLTIGGTAVSGSAWRDRVAWVPQHPGFTAGSVGDNLRMSAPEATDADLWSAIDTVGLTARLRRSDLGLETPAGEDARAFSGGERARLAFARALLSQRPWVLLDEPTAMLDPANRRRIVDLIVHLAGDAAVVIATHDPELIARADQVVALTSAAVEPQEAEPGRTSELRPAPTKVDHIPARLVGSMALEGLASASGVALTATAGWLIVKASEQPPILTMLVAIVGVRAFGLGRPVLRYAGRLIGHDAALRLLAQRRIEVYEAVVPLTPGALGRDRGDVLAAAVDDVEGVADRQLRVNGPVASAAIVGFLAVALALVLSPVVALVLAVTCVVAGTVAFAGGWLGGRARSQDEVENRAGLASCVVEAATLAPELVMWDATDRVRRRGMAFARSMSEAARRSAIAVSAARSVCLVACTAGMLTVAAIGGTALAAGRLSGPEVALLTLIPLALLDVLTPLAEAGALSRRVAASTRRLEALAARTPVVTEPALPGAVPSSSDVCLQHVSAGWSDALVLDDLTLTVPHGSRVAVIGPSGCGKSTMAALLARFLDPRIGDVRLGDRALSDLALADVRARVGILDDSPYVFATSVAENLRIGRRDATDAEMTEALASVGLDTWLSSLPHGMNSMIGEGGSGLSGGERSRFALARALLADRAVLVLDEPTAHLDRGTAKRTMDSLLTATGVRSLVWITHTDLYRERMDDVVDLGAERPVAHQVRQTGVVSPVP